MNRQQDPSGQQEDTTQIIGTGEVESLRGMLERIPSLVVIDGEDRGRVFKLVSSAMSIGRGTNASIQLNDKTVSRKHCLLAVTPAHVTLIDLESSNGTLVNDARISKKKLTNGDKIRIGSTVLKFEFADTEIANFQEQAYQAITFDDLTSLYNRKHMIKHLELLFRAKSNRRPFCLLFLDLDHFKQVNDTFDHLTGSEVLSEIGRMLLSNLRATDVPCRYGGEEFVLILPDTTAAQAVIVAEKIRTLVEQHRFFARSGAEFRITVSIGIAERFESCRTPEDLIALADEAMYKAKQWGRNRCVLRQEQEASPYVVITPASHSATPSFPDTHCDQ